jgi:dipeptidyl aminopeptidase/acylaminoacyl peptidase
LWLDFDGVMAATWDGNGALARYANKRRDLGWFAQQGEEMSSTSLPLDSTPWWAPGNRDVAWTRPPATHINLGYPPRHRSFAAGGRVLGMAWAPSGEEVYALAMDERGDSSLVRVRRALTRIQVLRAGLDASPLPNSLAVSPDGELVFVALASDGPVDPESRHDPGADRDLDIYAVSTRSGEIRRVIAAPGDDFWPWLAGDALYWTHNEQRASVALVAVGGDAGAAPVIVAGYEIDGVDAQLPRWGPSGGRLAYTRGAWRLADWGLPFDAMVTTVSAAGRAAASAPLVAGYHQDLTPVWSPDGRWLAYHSRRSRAPVPHYAGAGVADDIFVRPADDPGAPEVRVSEHGWEVGGPSWLADGRLLFDSWDRDGVPGISRPLLVEIDAGTGRAVDVRPLPLPDGIDGPVSAVGTPRAGEVLLIERIDAGSQALWLARLDGEEAERLLDFESPTAAGADWMPDGHSLVYSALADDRLQLFEVARAGGTPRRITSGAASYLHPSVSPDGRWIAATKLDQRKELRRIALADLR